MTDIKSQALDAILRTDFASFVHKAFETVVPGDEFQPNWHIEAMAWHLSEVAAGRIKRLLITVPPRSLKSICASVAFPAWVLGNDPARRIICLSYSVELAKGFANGSRAVMSSAWYRRVFPRTRIDSAKNAETEIMTTARGFRFTTSVQGTLTGRGGNLIIIDEPMKAIDAFSETERKNVKDWFTNTLLSRLDNKSDDAIVVVMQRLHEDDLAGMLLEKGGWTHLNLPAIAETEQAIRLSAKRVHRRALGEALHAARESLETLEKLKNDMEPFAFAAQYQQDPLPASGNLINPEWLKYYASNELPEKFDTVLQSWDTASKESEFANFSVCTTWGFQGSHAYLIDVFRRKLDFPSLRAKAIELARLHHADVVIIEEKASGIALVQDLRHNGVPVEAAPLLDGNKTMRLLHQSAQFESGFVHLPKEAHWLEAYVLELTTFPTSRYDDQVDSTVYALAWTTQRVSTPGLGLFEFYEREARKLTEAPMFCVRMKAPANAASNYQLRNGRSFFLPGDRIVTVTEEEAHDLLALGFTRCN